MSAGMNWWDAERIGWYERAAASSSFHRLLAEDIEKIVPKGLKIVEQGCGLGYIAEILANDGYDITAEDIDGNAIRRATARSGLPIFRESDFSKELPRADAMLLIYFGRIAETDCIDRLLDAAPLIIYTASHHRGQQTDRRIRKGNIEATIDYLEQKGLPYSRKVVTYDFSQPLLSLSDARRYIARMYGEENIDAYMPFLEKGRDYPFMLRNMKTSSIFTIRREK